MLTENGAAISLRLEKDLLEALRLVAKANERSVSAQVRQFVKDGLTREKEKNA